MRRCYRGVRLKKRFLGLEPLDGGILLSVYWVLAVIGGRTTLAMVSVAIVGALLRLFKVNRLPGVWSALGAFLLLPSHLPAFGSDTLPTLPQRRPR